MINPVLPHFIWIWLLLLVPFFGDSVLVPRAWAAGGAKVTRYPNTDAPGNDAKWVGGIASVEQCEKLCLADAACAGYTYNIKRSACIPKTAISPLSPAVDPAITGIVERPSGGLAAQNRAIKIEGKPSFDCRKAKSDTSQTICGSYQLINLDLQLAKLYWAKMAKLKGSSADGERRRQYDWGIARNQCGADAACVEQSYQRRIAEFGGQVQVVAVQASQAPPPVQQASEQRPQSEAKARPEGPIGTVQQLPNPIRLIGKADQPCDVASATLARLRKTLSVSVPGWLTVQAESLNTFNWKTSGAPPLGPAYLVLAADAPVRFQGKGFYALTPEAAAPFRIKQFFKQTRVIVPLHVKGAPQSGEVKIRPLIAGQLKVSAAIIGYTQCGENPDLAPIAFDLKVEPGAPEIVVADRFDLAKPDQIIASPDGKRRLEIYGPRYHLIDVATGALLADEVGKEPRFSPTGRFVIARAENRYTIWDAIDGKIIKRDDYSVQRIKGVDIAWDNRDSFIIPGDIDGDDSFVVNDPLQGEQIAGCWFDTGSIEHNVQVTTFKVDLENNIAFGNDGVASLSTNTGGLDVCVDAQEETLKYFIRAGSEVVPFSRPKRWDVIEGLKFTHVDDAYWDSRKTGEDKRFAAELKRFVVPPIIITQRETESAIAEKEPLRVASRGLGIVNLPEAKSALRQEQRLRDFGVEINHGIRSVMLEKTHVLQKIGTARFQFVDDSKIRVITDGSATFEGGWHCGIRRTATGILEVFVSPDIFFLTEIQAPSYRLTLFSTKCVGGSDEIARTYLHDSRHPGQLVDMYKKSGVEYVVIRPQVEFFFSRYLVVWSQEERGADVYDIEKKKKLHGLTELPSPDVMNRISLSKNLKTLVKLDKDGGFQVIDPKHVWDAVSALEEDRFKLPVLLSGHVVDDEVVIWTPSGQFDSTPEGASHVALRFPGRSGEYTLEQFHKLFHENDLLKRALAGEEFKPPRVKEFPPAITVTRSDSGDAIAAKIEFSGGDPVEEVLIFQDGLMTSVVPVAGEAKTVDVNAKRLPGSRWVAFLARGPSGLYSQPATFDAGPGAAARRRVHIVSVGIDHYDNLPLDKQLSFAASDATRFLKTLQDKAGTSVEIVSQSLLRDAAASREAILTKLSETIAKGEPGDSIILFIAGHGVQDPSTNVYYLATSAMKMEDMEHTALPWGDLSSVLAKAHTRIAVFLDTCQSGNAGTDFYATNDASVSALRNRVPSGIMIFSASKGREEAEEPDGGVFTSAVIDALSKKATDRNHNGVIEASELYATVKRAVVETTEGRQTPWFARNDMVGDFVPF